MSYAGTNRARDRRRGMKLREWLGTYARIAVVGPPRTGKTTLTTEVNDGRLLYHVDDLIGQPWEDQPRLIMERLEREPRYLAEGVQVARALRKGFAPDAVLVLSEYVVAPIPGQARLGASVRKWLNEWQATNRGAIVCRVDEER